MHLLHNPRSAKIRLFIAVALSVIAYFITPNMNSDILRALIAWNVGTWSEIIMTWAIILSSNSRTTKVRAAGNDPGRFFVHVIVLLSAAISLLASIVLMREHEAKAAHQALWWIVCLAGVGGSWVLNHTSWTFATLGCIIAGRDEMARIALLEALYSQEIKSLMTWTLRISHLQLVLVSRLLISLLPADQLEELL